MRGLRAAWRRHPWLLGGFVGASVIFVFFAIRIIVVTLYWSDPARQNQTLEGWMTPGYVARSWDVPRTDVLDMLGTVPPTSGRRTLEQIAQETGVPLAQVMSQLEHALNTHRSAE